MGWIHAGTGGQETPEQRAATARWMDGQNARIDAVNAIPWETREAQKKAEDAKREENRLAADLDRKVRYILGGVAAGDIDESLADLAKLGPAGLKMVAKIARECRPGMRVQVAASKVLAMLDLA